MAVTDWSTTPASNTAISGIDISEGCSPGGLNNAFRQIMADIRVFYDGVPVASTFATKAAAVFSGTQPIYTGRGAYLHHNSGSLASGRVFLQASGGSTPSGMVAGDWLLEY
jgi:hypothetical protein